MVYSPDSPYQSAYGTPPVPAGTQKRLLRGLLIAVAVLGLAAYGFSFGPVVDGAGAAGWEVRFAALAALCAGFGLLRTLNTLPVMTSALAAMGFLDALSLQVLGTDTGWALGVIVALNAVQSAAAIAALLMWPNPTSNQVSTAGYEAYVDYYNQAVQNYYSQQAHSAPPSTQRAGYGQASADAQAAPQVRRSQRAQPGDYAEFVEPHGNYGQATRTASPPSQHSQTPPPGRVASSGSTQPSAGQQENDAGQSAWP